jgi:GNAT superfamily N-acetyltransferase
LSAIKIQKVDLNSLEPAFRLLVHFFREEGFNTSAQDLRTNLQQMMMTSSSTLFLAWIGDKAVGVASVTSSMGLEYGRSAELEDLYVTPGERRQGVAGALIEQVCTWCRENRVSTILVTVTPDSQARHDLIEYYEKHGFVNTRRLILERSLVNGK